MVVVGFLLRVHRLAERAIHHDESLHALYSWYLYTGRGYVHDPMMHGPWQFHWTALIYFLFGDSDFTARLGAVLFGTAVHNTTLTGNSYEVCGDYAGFAQTYVQEHYPTAQAMFMLGCAGDADPYPRGKKTAPKNPISCATTRLRLQIIAARSRSFPCDLA